MAQIQPSKPGRKAVRYGVPVAVAGVAAATIGLVPALADTGDPELPEITAEELVTKMAKSDVKHMSGTVKINTDLGLPVLPGSGGGSGGEGPFGGDDAQRGGEGDKGGEQEGPGADPRKKLMELASGGHTLRVATDGPDKQRVSVVEQAAEYSFIHNGQDIWAYDSDSNSAFHAETPKGAGKGGQHKAHEGMADLTPEKAADQALKAVGKTTSVSVDGTAKVAGRDAYQLVLKPKDGADSTVESVRIAVDADNGTPLKFSLMPKDGDKAAIDIAYKNVDFGKPDADSFEFKAPKGAKLTEKKLDGRTEKKAEKPDLSGFDILGDGWSTVAEMQVPGGMPGAKIPGDKEGAGADQLKRLMDSFTDEVKGDFGTGRVFETRLVNALITDDGKVFAGAVTKDGLVKAADKAAK